ncbi:MAG: hypothetical protein C0503_01180 [Gemmatimonas sp.]|nr:hypothetical protein [Gemmatimonas sp.]
MMAMAMLWGLTAMPLPAQWVMRPGVGVFTLLRLEAEHETGARTTTAFALGVHPLAVPSLEALMRRQIGEARADGGMAFVDVAVLGFVPGTQFSDGSYPGVGLHVTYGRRWMRPAERVEQLRLGLGLYHEIADEPDAETVLVPVVGLEFGRRARK